MNTQEIYTAQLHVSKFYTIETITNLISKLYQFGEDVYYNNETKSIDILNPDPTYTDAVRDTIKNWLRTLPADKSYIDILINEINFVYNITIINIKSNYFMKIYLF